MKISIAYITVSAPYGQGEKFIIDEANEMAKYCDHIIVFPIRKAASRPFHNEGKKLECKYISLFSYETIRNSIKVILKNQTQVKGILISFFRNSHSFKNFIKNIVVFPKALAISLEMSKMQIGHIHAHWETTTSTVGYVCHLITKIPWSFSVHSGQILWNNMIEEKIRTSKFCRVISIDRLKDILQITKNKYIDKLKVIHMGVKLSDIYNFSSNSIKDGNPYNIVCVANLDKIKGHKYLIESIAIVSKIYPNIVCELIGSGKEFKFVKKIINAYSLQHTVKLLGAIPNEIILANYKMNKYGLFILPSIRIEKEKREEGIPVSLMEAMAYGIPVISTNTGAINELVENGISGILVNDKDSRALAEAIMKIAEDSEKQLLFSNNEINRIKEHFNIQKTSKLLYEEITK